MRIFATIILIGVCGCLTTSRNAVDRKTLAVLRFNATDTLLAPLAAEAREEVLQGLARQKGLTLIPVEPAARPRNRKGHPVNAYYMVSGSVGAPHPDSVVTVWLAIDVETSKVVIADTIRTTKLEWKAARVRLRRSAESATILTKPAS